MALCKDGDAHRLLIVEDDPVTAALLREILAGEGYAIAGICATGKDAIALARKSHPCVVLMDVALPGNLDGIGASQLIKDELDIPTIFISGHSPKHYVQRAKAVVPLAYLRKPFTEEQLRVTVDIALHKKRVEDREKEIQKNFEFLAFNATDGIVIGDKNARHVFANDAAARIIGCSVAELLKMKTTDVLHPDDIPMMEERYQKRFANHPLPEHFETRAVRKDGKIITVEVSSAKTFWHNQPAVLAIIRDISDRKRNEEQLQFHRLLMELELDKRKILLEKVNKKLREHLKKQIRLKREKTKSQRQWQNLVAMMNEGFLMAKPSGVITYVNPRLCEMTGFSASELIGKHWRDLLPKQFHNLLESKRKARPKGLRDSYETTWTAKDGTPIPVIHSASPLFDEKGNYQSVLVIITDITDLKKTQQALEKREAQLNEANLTLRTMLQKRKEAAAEHEKRMIHNMRVMVFPLLKRMKKVKSGGAQRVLTDRLEQTLTDLVSPFARTLSSELYNLSPTEIRIAQLIRQGHSNKQIAEILGLSPRTVEVHRTHIRKKLKLTHKKANLMSYLSTLETEG